MAQQPYQVRVTDKANAAARHVIECGLSQYNRAALIFSIEKYGGLCRSRYDPRGRSVPTKVRK